MTERENSKVDSPDASVLPRSQRLASGRVSRRTAAYMTPIETSVVAFLISTVAIGMLPGTSLTRTGYGLLPDDSVIGVIAYLVVAPFAALPIAFGIGFAHWIANRRFSGSVARTVLGGLFCCLAFALGVIWAMVVYGCWIP